MASRHQSSSGCHEVKRHVISRSFVCRLVSARCLHQNSKSSKTRCESTPSLQNGSQKGSFPYAFERIKQSLMRCSSHW